MCGQGACGSDGCLWERGRGREKYPAVSCRPQILGSSAVVGVTESPHPHSAWGRGRDLKALWRGQGIPLLGGAQASGWPPGGPLTQALLWLDTLELLASMIVQPCNPSGAEALSCGFCDSKLSVCPVSSPPQTHPFPSSPTTHVTQAPTPTPNCCSPPERRVRRSASGLNRLRERERMLAWSCGVARECKHQGAFGFARVPRAAETWNRWQWVLCPQEE